MQPMNISNLRRLRGITQVELADRAKSSQATISRAEKGDDSATLGIYKSIAEVLDVPLYALFADGRTKEEEALLHAYRRLSPERRRGWIDIVQGILSEREQSAPEEPETRRSSGTARLP